MTDTVNVPQGNFNTGNSKLDLLLGLTHDIAAGEGNMDTAIMWQQTLDEVLAAIKPPVPDGYVLLKRRAIADIAWTAELAEGHGAGEKDELFNAICKVHRDIDKLLGAIDAAPPSPVKVDRRDILSDKVAECAEALSGAIVHFLTSKQQEKIMDWFCPLQDALAAYRNPYLAEFWQKTNIK